MVVEVLVRSGVPERVGGATREALREPTTEHVERCDAMALDQSGLLEVLDALKAADVVTGPPGRRNVYQAFD